LAEWLSKDMGLRSFSQSRLGEFFDCLMTKLEEYGRLEGNKQIRGHIGPQQDEQHQMTHGQFLAL